MNAHTIAIKRETAAAIGLQRSLVRIRVVLMARSAERLAQLQDRKGDSRLRQLFNPFVSIKANGCGQRLENLIRL